MACKTVVTHRCSLHELDALVAKFVRHTDLWEGDTVWSINGLLGVPPESRLVRPAATPGPARTFDARLTQALKSAWGSEVRELGTVTSVWEVFQR